MFIQLTATMEKEFEIILFNTSLVTADEQKSRVVEGEYIGTERYYKRIKDNKRLVVTLGNLLMLVSTITFPGATYNLSVHKVLRTGEIINVVVPDAD